MSAEADFWFQRNVAVYVVNLATAIERWDQMTMRLKELDISATRVDGVDLSIGLEKATKAFRSSCGKVSRKCWQEGFVPSDWNFTVAKDTMVRLLERSSGAAAERCASESHADCSSSWKAAGGIWMTMVWAPLVAPQPW